MKLIEYYWFLLFYSFYEWDKFTLSICYTFFKRAMLFLSKKKTTAKKEREILKLLADPTNGIAIYHSKLKMIVVSWLIVSIGYNILSNFSHFFSMVRYEPTEILLFLVLPLIFLNYFTIFQENKWSYYFHMFNNKPQNEKYRIYVTSGLLLFFIIGGFIGSFTIICSK